MVTKTELEGTYRRIIGVLAKYAAEYKDKGRISGIIGESIDYLDGIVESIIKDEMLTDDFWDKLHDENLVYAKFALHRAGKPTAAEKRIWGSMWAEAGL